MANGSTTVLNGDVRGAVLSRLTSAAADAVRRDHGDAVEQAKRLANGAAKLADDLEQARRDVEKAGADERAALRAGDTDAVLAARERASRARVRAGAVEESMKAFGGQAKHARQALEAILPAAVAAELDRQRGAARQALASVRREVDERVGPELRARLAAAEALLYHVESAGMPQLDAHAPARELAATYALRQLLD